MKVEEIRLSLENNRKEYLKFALLDDIKNNLNKITQARQKAGALQTQALKSWEDVLRLVQDTEVDVTVGLQKIKELGVPDSFFQKQKEELVKDKLIVSKAIENLRQ